jgi:hypothetical protein
MTDEFRQLTGGQNLTVLNTLETHMAKGKPGADSSVLVTTQIGGKSLVELANELYGEPPVFWGRYFTSNSGSGNVEYRHLKENQLLRENNIRVLPIARQTRRVNGTQADGSADGEANVDDLLATFGIDYLASVGSEFYMFLDVEGSPSLSKAYYTGWAQTIVNHSATETNEQVQVTPCVYASKSDTPTWSAVSAAVSIGVLCRGAWVARWPSSGCQPLPDWDQNKILPSVAIPFEILAWQYADDCYGGGGFDCSETNPEIDLETELLSHLVLPQDLTLFIRGNP